MMQNTIEMRRNKKIALVAHDNKKEELFEWVKFNCKVLAEALAGCNRRNRSTPQEQARGEVDAATEWSVGRGPADRVSNL